MQNVKYDLRRLWRKTGTFIFHVMIRIYLHPLYIHKHVQGSQHIYQSAHILFLVSIKDNERDDSQIVADSC